MRNQIGIQFLIGLLWCSVLVFGKSSFVGEWQSRPNPVTGKPSITVNILASRNSLNGTVILVNPDGSKTEFTILRPELSGMVLRFQTNDAGAIFLWRMTLEQDGRAAILRGGDRRPAMRGQSGELLIEERVIKKR